MAKRGQDSDLEVGQMANPTGRGGANGASSIYSQSQPLCFQAGEGSRAPSASRWALQPMLGAGGWLMWLEELTFGQGVPTPSLGCRSGTSPQPQVGQARTPMSLGAAGGCCDDANPLFLSFSLSFSLIFGFI